MGKLRRRNDTLGRISNHQYLPRRNRSQRTGRSVNYESIWQSWSVSAHLVKREAGKTRLYKNFIGWPKTQLWGPHPRCRRSKLALLPIAAIGSGGPPLRPPPSKRQDTWGIMAGYIDIYRCG